MNTMMLVLAVFAVGMTPFIGVLTAKGHASGAPNTPLSQLGKEMASARISLWRMSGGDSGTVLVNGRFCGLDYEDTLAKLKTMHNKGLSVEEKKAFIEDLIASA